MRVRRVPLAARKRLPMLFCDDQMISNQRVRSEGVERVTIAIRSTTR